MFLARWCGVQGGGETTLGFAPSEMLIVSMFSRRSTAEEVLHNISSAAAILRASAGRGPGPRPAVAAAPDAATRSSRAIGVATEFRGKTGKLRENRIGIP